MCGIVGTNGPSNGVDVVIEGLTRLEYRGYDSAGLSYQTKNGLKVLRKEGKIANLVDLLNIEKPQSQTVIGHTRWATHGVVSEANAHPHANDIFSIVHNGIIENAYEIKKDLQRQGMEFKSETDSEVFLNLLTSTYLKNKDIIRSIGESFQQLKGNSAFVIICKDHSGIYAIKQGAPLVCGENDLGQLFISSDPYALVGFSQNLIFPEDKVVCHLEYRTGIKLYEIDGQASHRKKTEEKLDQQDVATKGEFEHFMIKEIHEQPELIEKAIFNWTHHVDHYVMKTDLGDDPHFYIIGCGTAWHAGLVIKNYIEKMTNHRCSVELASEFRYRKPKLRKNDFAIFISQSGETADTLACAQMCQQADIHTLSLVNVRGSTLYRTCDYNLLIHAGPEIGVASTKAFTMQAITGYLLKEANFYKEIHQEQAALYMKELKKSIEGILQRETEVKYIAEQVYEMKSFIFTGRADYFPIALEGALKVKEIAYVHAEGYAAGELKHGPIALIDSNVLNIAIVAPDLFDKTLSNAAEVRARKGKLFTIGPSSQKTQLTAMSDYTFFIEYEKLGPLAPLAVNVVLQLFSYYFAKMKGTDIDKPRNLAKSVTVE